MTYQELKGFCNSLTSEQLQQEVYLSIVDSHAEKIVSAFVADDDTYYDHGCGLGTLKEIKDEYPNEWKDIIADARICPKGTVFLINE